MQNRNLEHPSLEVLAALAEGRLGEDDKMKVTRHLSHCEDCYTLFVSTARFVEDTREEIGEREMPREVRQKRMLATLAAAAAIIVVSLITIVGVRSSTRDPVNRVVESANALPYRLTNGRLSADFAYRPAQQLTRGVNDSRDPKWLRLQGAAGEVLEKNPDSHAAASAYFATGETKQAEELLEKRATSDSENSATWNDLAVARIQLALEDNDPSILPSALAAADRALQITPDSAAAHFNRALAVEKLGLLSEARVAWEKYLKLDSDSEWAQEARTHLAALPASSDSWNDISSEVDEFLKSRSTSAPGVPRERGSTTDLEKRVVAFSRKARAIGEVIDLGRWGKATLANDIQAASTALDRARFIGAILASRRNEFLLQDAVAAIDRGGLQQARPLAAAHVRYDLARQTLARNPSEAGPMLEEASALFRKASSPMEFAAAAYLAVSLYEQQKVDLSLGLVNRLESTGGVSRYRTLSAQLAWQAGLCLFNQGFFDAAREKLIHAGSSFASLGEIESEAGARLVLADVEALKGDTSSSWRHRREAFRKSSLSGATFRELAAHSSAVRALLREGEPTSAAAVASIAIGVASEYKDERFVSDLHVHRAIARSQAGIDQEQVEDDLKIAAEAAMAIADRSVRYRAIAESEMGAALTATRNDSLPSIERAITFFSSSNMRFALPRLYLERSRRLRSSKRYAEAAQTAEEAIAILATQRTGIGDLNESALMFSMNAGELVDELLLAHLATGTLDAGFESLARAKGKASADLPDREHAMIEYRVTQSGVAIRLSTHRNRRSTFVSVDRQALRAIRDAMLGAISNGEENAIQTNSTRMGELLLSPVAPHLGGIASVAIVADDDLSAVPFALLPLAGKQPLIELMTVTMSRGSSRPLPSRTRHERSLVLADPAFFATEFAELRQLPGARAEGIAVAGRSAGRLLSGEEATVQAFEAAAPEADLIHISAHAIHNRRDPSRSAIVMAGPRSRALLSAERISESRLRNNPLVILSACEGSAAAMHRSDGTPNIAAAFLRAGASEVISTLWSVSDTKVVSLMDRLHRFLAEGLPAPVALRRMQQDAIANHMAPREWAAYVITQQ